jgi:hypothetical protein
MDRSHFVPHQIVNASETPSEEQPAEPTNDTASETPSEEQRAEPTDMPAMSETPAEGEAPLDAPVDAIDGLRRHIERVMDSSYNTR